MAVDRLNDGIVVRFESGRCIFYRALFLAQMATYAEEQDVTVTLW